MSSRMAPIIGLGGAPRALPRPQHLSPPSGRPRCEDGQVRRRRARPAIVAAGVLVGLASACRAGPAAPPPVSPPSAPPAVPALYGGRSPAGTSRPAPAAAPASTPPGPSAPPGARRRWRAGGSPGQNERAEGRGHARDRVPLAGGGHGGGPAGDGLRQEVRGEP